MPIYTCECCNYITGIKSHYTKHLETVKHLEAIAKPKENNELEELSEFVCGEIMSLKKDLEECKQLIMEMKCALPTYAPPTQTTPHNIVISQAPPEEKKVDETCNPRYIEKQFDEDLKYNDTPHIHAFFSIKQDHVMFDFDEVDDLETIADRGHEFVYHHITKYIKEKRSEGVEFPFAYYKSSWYIKGEDGWHRQEKINNKNKQPGHSDYKYDEPTSKFLFIINNRLIAHLWDTFGRDCLMSTDGARIQAEVLNITYHNRDVQKVIMDALS